MSRRLYFAFCVSFLSSVDCVIEATVKQPDVHIAWDGKKVHVTSISDYQYAGIEAKILKTVVFNPNSQNTKRRKSVFFAEPSQKTNIEDCIVDQRTTTHATVKKFKRFMPLGAQAARYIRAIDKLIVVHHDKSITVHAITRVPKPTPVAKTVAWDENNLFFNVA